MKNPKLEAITKNISTTEGQRATLLSLIGPRRDARLLIESATSAASDALGSAMAALETAFVRHACGEADVGEVAAARGAIVAAEKAVGAARKREGEARELAAAENGLTARMAPLDASLIELRTQLAFELDEAKLENLRSDMLAEIARYVSAANQAMLSLGKSYARHQALQAAGRDPGLFSSGLHQSQLGCFVGFPLTGSFAESAADERARLAAVA